MTGAPAPPTLLRTVVRNAASLTGGRVLLAFLRFVVALVVAQRAGLDRFGEFALILSFLLVAEWLSDFGLTDIAVRQRASRPDRRAAILGAFLACKAAQSVLASLVMASAVALMGYPEHVVRSALMAGVAVILYGGVQYYRVEFRALMTMERDVGAELAGAFALLLAVWIATAAPASLESLTLCFVLSRAVNLAVAAFLSRGAPGPGAGPGFVEELRVLAAASVPLGLTGLLVSAYDAMDAIALSQWSTNAEVGIFTVAMRILMLAVVAEQAIGAATYPVLAAQWSADRPAFVRTMQAVLDWGMAIGGAMFCALHAGAHGIALLLRQDPLAVAEVLQLLSWAILARVVVTLVSPMVVISGKLLVTVWVTAGVVITKGLALLAMASYGAAGAAAAYLVAEIVVGLVPTVILCQYAAGVRLDWANPLKLAAAAAAVAVATRLLDLQGSVFHGLLAMALFVALAAASGAVRLAPLAELYRGLRDRRRHHG